jgi:Putative lumazine-binding
MKKIVFVLFLSLICMNFSLAEGEKPVIDTKGDSEAIEITVKNYIEGWFLSDFERMTKALHPNLFKITIGSLKDSEEEFLNVMTAEQLIVFSKNNQTWVEGRSFQSMEIIFQDEQIAVVHAISDGFFDICNLAKLNGEWKIVQVLWAKTE